MTKTTMFEGPFGEIAVHESEGVGRPIVLIHGNSSSARAFSRQIEGPLGASHRLVAIDLMGHGRSADASDPAAYLLSGHARSLVALLTSRGIEDSILVGWSLGGHILLEAAPDLAKARGLVIFGTPPIGFPPAMDKPSCPIRLCRPVSCRKSRPRWPRTTSLRSSRRDLSTFRHFSSRTWCAPTGSRVRK